LIDKSSERCQLLIPIDSISKYKTELQELFISEIVNYQFVPDSEEKKLLKLDSSTLYPAFEKEDYGILVNQFTTKFEALGIYTGTGF